MYIKRLLFLLLVGVLGWNSGFGQLVLEENALEKAAPLTLKGEHVVNTAMKYVGVRYRRGATGPKYFDCSGFTSFVFRQKNVKLTRTSRSQYNEGEAVKKIADLKPGDLVFFEGSRTRGVVGHVGIVKEVHAGRGDFSFVHASRTGVKVDVLSSAYYKKRYIGARRVF